MPECHCISLYSFTFCSMTRIRSPCTGICASLSRWTKILRLAALRASSRISPSCSTASGHPVFFAGPNRPYSYFRFRMRYTLLSISSMEIRPSRRKVPMVSITSSTSPFSAFISTRSAPASRDSAQALATPYFVAMAPMVILSVVITPSKPSFSRSSPVITFPDTVAI